MNSIQIMMRIFLFILLFCGLSLHSVLAQKVLQLEKYGKAKVKKHFIGEELTFRLKDDKNYWYKDVIQDILVEEGIIIFSNRAVKLDEIDAIRSFKVARFGQSMSRNLFIFGASWTIFSLIGLPIGWNVGIGDAILVVADTIAAFLVRNLFRYRTFRVGKKRRLRLLDLNWQGRP